MEKSLYSCYKNNEPYIWFGNLKCPLFAMVEFVGSAKNKGFR